MEHLLNIQSVKRHYNGVKGYFFYYFLFFEDLAILILHVTGDCMIPSIICFGRNILVVDLAAILDIRTEQSNSDSPCHPDASQQVWVNSSYLEK